jgi:hypothetical protein
MFNNIRPNEKSHKKQKEKERRKDRNQISDISEPGDRKPPQLAVTVFFRFPSGFDGQVE